MAGFFDIGREKARHIVDKVSKAAYLRDVHRSGSSADNMDVTSKLPSASQKTYAFTTFKRALDDTDTLLLRDTSFNRTFSLSRTSEPAANRSPSADAGTGSTESSRQGPPANNSAWDLPLTSFAKAPRAAVLAQSGPNDVPQTAPTPAAVGDCDNAATLVATSKSEAAHAVENVVRPPAIAAAAAEGTTCSAPEAIAAAAEVRHESGPEPTLAAAPLSTTAGSSVTAASAASSDVDAILEVPVSAVHNSRPAAIAHQPDQSSVAAAAAAPTVSRPGVADAANLIAPGLVAKRRMAAIAAVESKEGPSPELQATPVIVTEGAGEKSKAGSRVKLSAW